MPRFATLAAHEAEDMLIREAEAQDLVLVRPEILVHSRRKKVGRPCPCCGSRRARITKRKRLSPVLFDRDTGDRWIRSEIKDQSLFDDQAEDAHVVELPLRIPDSADPETDTTAYDVVMDFDTVATTASGGNQGGKTTLGTHAWLPLRWLYMGGREHIFRLIGPDLHHAWILATKMFIGQAGLPPAIPSELIEYIPTDPNMPLNKRTIRMIDGSQFQLLDAKKPGKWKGDRVYGTQWTEVTECPHVEGYVIATGRAIMTGGQIFMDSTPVEGHWLEDIVKGNFTKDHLELKEGDDDDDRPMFLNYTMASANNPWANAEAVARQRAAAYAIDPVMAAREYDGKWVGKSAKIYGHVWDPVKHIIDIPGGPREPNLSAFGLMDVTPVAARKFFGSTHRHDWVCGVDVNKNPHTALACKVFVREGQDPTDSENWGLYVHDEIRTPNCDALGAAEALYHRWEGLYRGAGVAIDANAAHHNQHVSHTGGRATTPVLDYKRMGFNCRPNLSAKGKPQNPFIKDRIALTKFMLRSDPPRLIVNSLCSGLIRAIERQEDKGDGTPVKVPNTWSDREIAAYVEGVHYLAWPIFSPGTYVPKTKMIKGRR